MIADGCAARGSGHRCGDCGDEPTYAIADLDALYEEFDRCDWTMKGVDVFLDWLRSREELALTTTPPDGECVAPLRFAPLMCADDDEEEDDVVLAP